MSSARNNWPSVPVFSDTTHISRRHLVDMVEDADSIEHAVCRLGHLPRRSDTPEIFRAMCAALDVDLGDLADWDPPQDIRAARRPRRIVVVKRVPRGDGDIPRGVMVDRQFVLEASRDAAGLGESITNLGISKGDPDTYRRIKAAAACFNLLLPYRRGAPTTSRLADDVRFVEAFNQATNFTSMTQALGVSLTGKMTDKIIARSAELGLHADWCRKPRPRSRPRL